MREYPHCCLLAVVVFDGMSWLLLKQTREEKGRCSWWGSGNPSLTRKPQSPLLLLSRVRRTEAETSSGVCLSSGRKSGDLSSVSKVLLLHSPGRAVRLALRLPGLEHLSSFQVHHPPCPRPQAFRFLEGTTPGPAGMFATRVGGEEKTFQMTEFISSSRAGTRPFDISTL